MNFAFDQQFEEDMQFITCSHLRDYAESIGVNTDLMTVGLCEEMEQEQLTAIAQELKQEIDERLRLESERKYPACDIGPYADGFCTICGGRQP